MKRIFVIVMVILLVMPVLPAIPVQAADVTWELVETRLSPAKSPVEGTIGTPLQPGEERSFENMDGYTKRTGTIEAGKMAVTAYYEDWEYGQTDRDTWVSYTVTSGFEFTAPDAMTVGETVTFKVTGTVNVKGQWPSGILLVGEKIHIAGQFFGADSFQYVVDGKERIDFTCHPAESINKTASVSYKVPEGDPGEEIIIYAYGPGINTEEGLNITWIYRANTGEKLSLDYYPPLVHFKPGTGTEIVPAGDLVATFKDENGKGIKGKEVIFFVEKEIPAMDEPGKNLFNVLDFEDVYDNSVAGAHSLTKTNIRLLFPELDGALTNSDRIFVNIIGRTNNDGEARINLIEQKIIDPRKFASELIYQRSAFLDKGKISGKVIAGIFDKETGFITPQSAMEIEYAAIAAILKITGEGRPDNTETGKKYPGRVRVKRPIALPHFDYKPVEEGFFLLPGDIVDIDGNAAVEIAWINGDKVTARVPDKIKMDEVREAYEPPEAEIILLSSAYDTGFYTTEEKIGNTICFFGGNKGIEFIIESIPYVGKVLKEGGALAIEVLEGIKDVDLSQTKVVTRIRIRSRVLIDNTGDGLKIFNIEGSPSIETASGVVALSNGEMATVSDEGVISQPASFNTKNIESDFYTRVPAISTEGSCGTSKGNLIFLWIIIAVAVIGLPGAVVVIKRARKNK